MDGPRRRGWLRADRRPGSMDEARAMVAYNQRILETSQSPQRRYRAERMLVNLKPWLAQLEEQRRTCPGCGKPRPPGGTDTCPDCLLEQRRLAAIAKVPPRPPIDDDDLEVVFSGKDSLSKFRKENEDESNVSSSSLIGDYAAVGFKR